MTDTTNPEVPGTDITNPEAEPGAVVETHDDETHDEAPYHAAPDQIALGCFARDVVTGFQGIIIQKMEKYNGNVMYALQAEMKDGEDKYPEAMFIDDLMLNFVHEGVMDRVTPVMVESGIVLGDMVEDIATGFKGIALEKSTFLNGCVFFAVVPKAVKSDLLNNKNPSGSMIDAGRLEVCRKGGIAHLLPAPAVLPDGRSPGGPSHRVSFRG
jgi:hypothetical protein